MGALAQGVLDEARQAARAERDEGAHALVLVQPQRQLAEADRLQQMPYDQVAYLPRSRRERRARGGRPHREPCGPQRQPVEGGAHLPQIRLPHRGVETRTERQLLAQHTVTAQPRHGGGHVRRIPAYHRLVRTVVVADHHPVQIVERGPRPRRAAAQGRVDEIRDPEITRPQ